MKNKKICFLSSLIVLSGMILGSHTAKAEVPTWPDWDGNPKTGWQKVADPVRTDITSWLNNPDKNIIVGDKNKALATVATGFSPGGVKRATAYPSEDTYFLRRRVDIPFIEFLPKSVGLNLGIPYKRASLGRNVDLGQSGAVRPAWNLNLKSLGLVFAVEDDVSTIQEASMGKITKYDLSPEEPTIDRTTFKVYTKEVSRVNLVNGFTMTALKYVYEVTIKDRQGDSYRVQVDQSYFPSKDGRVRVSFDIKNIGDKVIPKLMVGYNYTPEVKFTNYNINNTPNGSGIPGTVKYLGKNLGVYAVDGEGIYRAEIYPTFDRYGADSWAVWAEPFIGTYGMGSRDSSVFMKGFDDPSDLFSKGQEDKGIVKDTPINDEPKTNVEGGSDTTISMKWNPQDLAVGDTRNTAWIYGSEIKDIYPLLNLIDEDRKYAVAKDGEANAILRGTWRTYETITGAIKYTIDDGEEHSLHVHYDSENDMGSIELFEIPLTFKPTADHTVKIYMEDAEKRKTDIKTIVYSFDYPEPKLNGTSSIKVNNKVSNKIAIGGEFTYNMNLAMQTPYSKLFGNKASIPIDTTIIDPTSLKDISITDGNKVVKGMFNSIGKTLDFTFDDDILADGSLQAQFTGKIIDSDSLIGESLVITPSEVIGKSGVETDFKDYSMPIADLPQATATIVSKVSAINIRYLIEGTTTPLGDELSKEGLIGSSDSIPSKVFTGYLLSKIMIDGVEQKPLTDPVSIEYGETSEVIFYYQVKPILETSLAISLPEISEGGKVTFTSTFKNTATAPSDLTDVLYETTEVFPKNVTVDLDSVKLNGQHLEAKAAIVDNSGKLKVNLGDLKSGVDYTLTYDVVSTITTPPLANVLEVKQAYTLSGKSADKTTVRASSGEVKIFTIKPRVADIAVQYLEEETETELAQEQLKQGVIGEETTFIAKTIKGYVLSKVIIDSDEQPLSSVVKVKYGEHSTVRFYYKGVLEFSSVPSTMNFGTKALDGNEIRVNQPSYDAPLVVSDSRSDKKSWTLKAKITTPLTNENGKIIVGAIRYKSPESDEFPLNEGTQTLLTASNTETYDVSATWGALKDSPGFKFELPAVKVKELGKYKGMIEYSLEDTYKP
ncbi:hypothetical protein UAY_00122 [Enterococcus moraviensis ATCC BAA-383]|uniref:MucBP domain-containing protein n=1 Tax=Enterococcus moraviensis ATCC BAA-383 TaxID=1158609 RepID=R2RCM7_9ENTE|nr:hypothetical protein [Enterococcus moraviensis]EOI06780.1 hypothetical protein UAY_00122 [Enterococcus moraviensis ATCC BAA-383]EOT65117.1 hypothetical protein I586_02851 [Enterococcus moraviensis ATCC BAA-383]OJG66962.1 hypothetical protein RV09_GL003179 [Enterococcus moraviensis]